MATKKKTTTKKKTPSKKKSIFEVRHNSGTSDFYSPVCEKDCAEIAKRLNQLVLMKKIREWAMTKTTRGVKPRLVRPDDLLKIAA